jgi:hypothetical protein
MNLGSISMNIYRTPQPLRLNQPNGRIPLPAKEEFVRLYEQDNKSRKQLADHYNVHKGTIDNWCKVFGVKKTKEQQVALAVKNTPKRTNRDGQYSDRFFEVNPHLKDADAVFYRIRIYNDEESFIKYGITRLTTKERYKGRLKHYQYDILEERRMCLYDAYLLEKEYKDTYKHTSYSPKHSVGGHTECYISHPPAAEHASC